jgi:hypothetical protein
MKQETAGGFVAAGLSADYSGTSEERTTASV